MPAPEDDVVPAPERVVPRKLSLRVNGARRGIGVRAADGDVVAVAPAQRFGLRVNSAARTKRP